MALGADDISLDTDFKSLEIVSIYTSERGSMLVYQIRIQAFLCLAKNRDYSAITLGVRH
jgi:hypothetical protein